MKVRLSSVAAVVGSCTVPGEPHKSHYSVATVPKEQLC